MKLANYKTFNLRLLRDLEPLLGRWKYVQYATGESSDVAFSAYGKMWK
jgi:hypothetical protein